MGTRIRPAGVSPAVAAATYVPYPTVPPVGHYLPMFTGTSPNTFALTEARLYLVRFFVPPGRGIDRVCVTTTGTVGGTGSVIRLGVYASGASALPATLLADGGTVSGTSNGFKEATVALSSATVGGRWIWLGAVAQGGASPTATVRSNNAPGGWEPGVTHGTTGWASDTVNYWVAFVAGVTGALADVSIPTDGGITVIYQAPVFKVRLAA